MEVTAKGGKMWRVFGSRDGRTKDMGGGVGERGIPRTDGDEIGWEFGRMHKMGRQLGKLRDHRDNGDEIGRKSGRTGPAVMKSGGNHVSSEDIWTDSKRGQRMGGRWEK